MHDLMQMSLDRGASDIHLRVNRPPVLRLDGGLVDVDAPPMKPEDTEELMKSVTPDSHLPIIDEIGGSDFAYAYKDLCRFRMSVFRERQRFAVVARLIPGRIYSFEELGLSPKIKELLCRPRGLVLVCGPTGSGKTTSLAAMIDWINIEHERHIITVEDPVEFLHPHKQGIMTQRELGVDTPSFKMALRHALRQDPDVILVGELRDLETIEAAVTAAETGHLVFGTLHTNSASETVDRIIDVFPTNQQSQIRAQLAAALEGVICQTLCRKARGTGRVAAFEIMIATAGIKNMIRDEKTYNIPSAIQTGGQLGMQTLDQHLQALYSRGLITYDTAMEKAANPSELAKQL